MRRRTPSAAPASRASYRGSRRKRKELPHTGDSQLRPWAQRTAMQPYGTACGLRVRPGPVVLLSYEDRPRRTWHRFRHVASADNCNIPEDAQANVHVIDPAAPLYEADPETHA